MSRDHFPPDVGRVVHDPQESPCRASLSKLMPSRWVAATSSENRGLAARIAISMGRSYVPASISRWSVGAPRRHHGNHDKGCEKNLSGSFLEQEQEFAIGIGRLRSPLVRPRHTRHHVPLVFDLDDFQEPTVTSQHVV